MIRGTRCVGFVACLAASLAGCANESADPAGESQTESEPSSGAPAALVPLDSALSLAEATYLSGELVAAQEILRPVLDRARAADDVSTEAIALTWLGLAAWRLGDNDQAARLGTSALDLKLEHGLTEELFASYNALGLLAYYENRYIDASNYLASALRSTNTGGKVGDFATARQNLALVQTEWGDFQAAREGFLAFHDTMTEFGHHFESGDRARRMGAALTNLGMLEVRVGNPAAAVEWLLEAVDVYREGYPPGEGFSLGHLATAYSLLGEQDRAFSALDTALEKVRAQGLRQEEASNLEVMAEQYREAGDFRRALALYYDARQINDELSLTVESGSDLRGEAEIHLSLGTPERAVIAAAEALDLHQKAGAALDELYDHVTLAEIHHVLGNIGDVSRHLATAREMADELSVRSARVAVAMAEARIADRESDHAAVLRIMRAAAVDVAFGGYAEQWQSSHLVAGAFSGAGMLDSAAVAGWSALTTVERVRGRYGSGALRTAFSSDKRDVYAQLMNTLIELDRVDEALIVSDAARGRVLVEGAPSAGDATADPSGVGDLRLREIDGVLESIDLIETGVNGVGGVADVQALGELYARLGELRSGYESAIMRSVAGGGELVPEAARRLDIGGVRRALREDEVLVEYFVPTEGRIKIFALDRRSLVVLDSELSTRNLRSRVRIARDLMSDSDDALAAYAVLEGLHAALVQPVIESGLLNDAERLLVVSHDALAYLPFSVLRDEKSKRFLVEDFEIRVLPTAASVITLADRGSGRSRQTEGGLVLAPFPTQLPGTDREAQAVREGISNVSSFVGSGATEAELREGLWANDFVHVATHGVMNSRNPMFSRVLLADGMSGKSDDDGRLEVHELLGIRARAGLVFLSGCETALGRAGITRFSSGDDYVTLAQAFLQSGVRNVIATLWRVDDEAAAIFAEFFYEELRSHSPGEALAAVQRRMSRDPRYAAPYYWAGYQLLGDGASVPVAQ